MKKTLTFFIVFGIISNFICENSYAQNIAKPWTTNNPFKTDVFVENLGQFDSWAKTPAPIKYAINNNDKIFFTQQGLTFQLEKIEVMSEEQREEIEREGGKISETYYVNMQWEGCNNASLEVSEQSEGYYTYGTKGYENVKAKGYKKLIYKNLYEGIDIEYNIPDKGGIKYSLIVHPGADANKVKMKYTGDVDKIEISSEGNIIIKTATGDITDHAPKSFYKTTSETISSSFKLEENIVSFQLQAPQSKSQTIIVDPWTQSPTSLTTDKAAYDIDYDYNGNVYVSGGTFRYKLAKYSKIGTVLWTYTNEVGWAPSGAYSRFCILPQSGTVFITEGTASPAPRVRKISSGGTLQLTSIPFLGTNEIWKMFYNRCTGQLIGFGGGTTVGSNNNLQLIADTNLTSSTVKNFNGSGNATTSCNDITSVDMDNNGDFYAIMSSYVGMPSINNRLQKSRYSTSYNPPVAFNRATPSGFQECTNLGIPGFDHLNTVRANCVAVNPSYLYTFDGGTLIAWDKTSGAIIDSVEFGGPRGQFRTHEGIAVNECNYVFVGGWGAVYVYFFDGTTFNAVNTITTNIPNAVYDICLGQMNKLYVCGLGFVTEISLTTPPCNELTLTASASNTQCTDTTGVATANVTGGGTPPYHYSWSPGGQTTQTITGLSPGTYTVVVTDNNCNPKMQSTSVTITSPSTYTTAINSSSNVSCNGGANGSATVTPSSGTPPYTYLWSPSGQTTAIATNLSAGIHTVTVMDANHCTATSSVTITQPIALTSTISQSNVLCYAGNTGSATVTPSGGTPNYSYLWSTTPAQTNQTATGLTVGSYTVTITDSKNCKSTSSVTITQPTLLATSVSTTLAGCGLSDGTATVTPSGGTGSYTYNWSAGGQTNSTATGLAAGSYTVTTTDANNCSKIDNVSVSNNNAPTTSTTQINIKCHGDNTGSINLTVSGGTLNYTYSWNGGTYTIEDLSNLPAGIYSYIVTDAVNCKSTGSVTITEPTVLTVTPSPTNLLCNGYSTGSINLAVSGGTTIYTYLWSTNPAQTTATASNLTAGTYTYTVTDANLCTNTSSVTITQPTLLTTSTTQSNVLCYAGNTGSATVTGSGGTPNYSYLWNTTPAQTTSTATGLTAGSYTVTITDSNNCKSTSSVTITQPTVLTTSIDTTYAGCGLSNGTATVTASGGTVNYTYNWSSQASGQTTATATGLSAGSYVVTTTDAHGCSKINNVIIANFNAPTTITTQVNIKCNGSSTGSINLTVSGGTGTYTYDWNNGETTEDLSNLSAGTYSYTITDAVNCKTTGSATITEPPVLIASSSATNILCHGINATVTVASTGGTGAVTGTGTFIETAGTYNYTITDANGCTAITYITIPEPDTLIASSSSTIILCHGGTSSVEVTSTGGTGIVSGIGTYIVSAGVYSYTVTDVNGCKSTVSETITEPDDLIITPNTNDPTCNGSNGSVSIHVNGGVLPYTYLWSNSDNDSLASGLSAGSYTVTVSDYNNCSKTSTANLYSPPSLVIDSSSFGVNNFMGYVHVVVAGGSPTYTFNWSNNQSTIGSIGDITNLTTGEYTVTITDSRNCTITATFKIDVPFIIPSVITPNEDGINDNFQIVGIEGYDDVSIEIYNRWGDILFIFNGTGKAYGNPANRWKGEHNGKKLPMGSYVYIVKLGKEIDPISGVVSIVR